MFYAKIAGKFMFSKILSILKPSFGLFQHEFVLNKSAITCLIECFEDWTSALDRNFNAGIIFFDIHRAFEFVDQKRLINKLEYYGIQGTSLHW